MKKIVSVFIICLFLVSTVFAVEQYSSDEGKDSFWGNIFQGSFAITGTREQWTGGETEFNRGEIFSRTFTLTFDKKSSHYEIEFYFYKNGKPIVDLGKKKYNYPHEPGDTATVTLANIDTGLVPVNLCNEDVRLGGRHLLYGHFPECDGNSGLSLPNGMTCGVGDDSDIYISTTRPGVTFQDETAGLFKIICSDVADPCLDKKGDDAGKDPYCKLGNLVKEVYTGKQLNGICTTTTYLYRACESGCENSKCISQLKSNGESCMYNGLERNDLCESGMCVVGKCASTLNDVGGTCINEGDCLGGLSCVKNYCASNDIDLGPDKTGGGGVIDTTQPECVEDLMCGDGQTILMQCKDGFYGDIGECPPCSDDSNCQPGFECNNNVCELEGGEVECETSADCSSLYTCKFNTCIPKDDTTPTVCYEDTDCGDGFTCEGIQCVEKVGFFKGIWNAIADFFRGLFGG